MAADQARFSGMLEQLQQQDAAIESILIYSKFVVAYLLQQDGPNPGWRKANIEGPIYLVRRRANPQYQLLVKNQFSQNDLLDSLHADWELDCQKNYVFYKVEDTSKRIRGLWFHDDTERQRVETSLERVLEEIRNQPSGEPQTEPQVPQPIKRMLMQHGDALPPGMGGVLGGAHALPPGMGGVLGAAEPNRAASDSTALTAATLRSVLHALADDDNFVRFVLQKIKDVEAQA